MGLNIYDYHYFQNVLTYFLVVVLVPIHFIFGNVLNNEVGKCNMNKLSSKWQKVRKLYTWLHVISAIEIST